jgi:hypothetical protein
MPKPDHLATVIRSDDWATAQEPDIHKFMWKPVLVFLASLLAAEASLLGCSGSGEVTAENAASQDIYIPGCPKGAIVANACFEEPSDPDKGELGKRIDCPGGSHWVGERSEGIVFARQAGTGFPRCSPQPTESRTDVTPTGGGLPDSCVFVEYRHEALALGPPPEGNYCSLTQTVGELSNDPHGYRRDEHGVFSCVQDLVWGTDGNSDWWVAGAFRPVGGQRKWVMPRHGANVCNPGE